MSILLDYHIHTINSADANFPARAMLNAAEAAGLDEICFTDHIDFDDKEFPPCDMAAQKAEIDALESNTVTIRRGIETGLATEESSELAWEYIKDWDLDFIIGSLHLVNGENTYYPTFFDTRTQEQGYMLYLETLDRAIRTCPYFSIMGHYDFVTKYAPFKERALRYSFAPELFDSIFRYLVENGKSLEINTSAWQNDAAWGLDILKRYVAMGGEFVTVGSDSHVPEKVGRRIPEAIGLARAAGIKYIATYKKLTPTMHKI